MPEQETPHMVKWTLGPDSTPYHSVEWAACGPYSAVRMIYRQRHSGPQNWTAILAVATGQTVVLLKLIETSSKTSAMTQAYEKTAEIEATLTALGGAAKAMGWKPGQPWQHPHAKARRPAVVA